MNLFLFVGGYLVMCAAGLAVCIYPMAGLPIGIVGAAAYLIGSYREAKDHVR